MTATLQDRLRADASRIGLVPRAILVDTILRAAARLDALEARERELVAREKLLTDVIRTCLLYLEHQDVRAIPFATRSEVVAEQVRSLLAPASAEVRK